LAQSTAQWLLPQRTAVSSDAASGTATGVGLAVLSKPPRPSWPWKPRPKVCSRGGPPVCERSSAAVW
jgi:hypothetical protein